MGTQPCSLDTSSGRMLDLLWGVSVCKCLCLAKVSIACRGSFKEVTELPGKHCRKRISLCFLSAVDEGYFTVWYVGYLQPVPLE